MKSLHIKLDDDKVKIIKDKAKENAVPMSSIVSDALDFYFKCEGLDHKANKALDLILSKVFTIPEIFTPRSFYLMLWMLATMYPQQTSSKFWGKVIFTREKYEDKTHDEIYKLIKSNLKHIMG